MRPRHLQMVSIVWEHSPTRRKENPLARINRGVNSPINCHYPLLLPNIHVATWPASLPLGCARPGAPPARATRALPRGLGAASQPGLGPACHVSPRLATSAPTSYKTPFFAILLIENPNKNQIKFRKIHKTSEIHISQNTTPF